MSENQATKDLRTRINAREAEAMGKKYVPDTPAPRSTAPSVPYDTGPRPRSLPPAELIRARDAKLKTSAAASDEFAAKRGGLVRKPVAKKVAPRGRK